MVAMPMQVTVAVRRPARMKRGGERQFDLEQSLRIRQADRARDFDERRIDAANAGIGVAQDGKQARKR